MGKNVDFQRLFVIVQMIRSGNKINIPILDGFRAFAILLVLVYHLRLDSHFYPLRLINAGGWMGVQLFFILSGFLLSLDYIYAGKSKVEIPLFSDFFRNRILRIFPLYFLGLSVYILLKYFNNTFTELPQLISYFLFLQNYYPENWPIYDSYWSLAVEIQIYLIFPLIGYGLYTLIKSFNKGFLPLFMIILCGAPLIYRFYISVWNTESLSQQDYILWIYKSSFSNLDSFAWGIVGAMVYVFGLPNRISSSVLWVIRLISIVMIISLFHYTTTHRSWYLMDGYFAPAIFYTLINISWVTLIVSCLLTEDRLLNRLVMSKVVLFIAKISFGMYVWHGLVFFGTRKLARLLDVQDRIGLNLFLFIMVMSGTILLATLTYYFVELPFLRLKKKG
jgi:peptidoglycan/LPS O-acetylase OafA/YrhL